MKNTLSKLIATSASVLFTSCLFTTSAAAQNSVVVVPLAGDTEYVDVDAFDRTVVVGGSGTDAENGTALIEALDLVATATAADPWLIQVEPGVFDLGDEELALNPYVSLRGSGIGVTTIVGSSIVTGHHTIELQGGNMLSNLSVSDSSAGSSTGAVVTVGNDVRISHIQVTTTDEDGIRVDNFSDNVIIEQVFVTAVDRAVSAQSGNDNIVVRDSVLASSGDNVVNVGNSSSVQIFNSQLTSTAATKEIFNLLSGDLEVGFSKLQSTSTRTILTPSAGQGNFTIYHSHVDSGAAYSFNGNSDNCFATTTPVNFFTTACQ